MFELRDLQGVQLVIGSIIYIYIYMYIPEQPFVMCISIPLGFGMEIHKSRRNCKFMRILKICRDLKLCQGIRPENTRCPIHTRCNRKTWKMFSNSDGFEKLCLSETQCI